MHLELLNKQKNTIIVVKAATKQQKIKQYSLWKKQITNKYKRIVKSVPQKQHKMVFQILVPTIT